jgi:hypothetical protein
MIPAAITRSAWMGIVSGRVGSAAFSSSADAPGPAFNGERIGKNADRLASSEKVLVWYLGVRPLAQGRAQIWRKWTCSFDSFCSECAIPAVEMVSTCATGREITRWGKTYHFHQ